jgi:hypothetical protein
LAREKEVKSAPRRERGRLVDCTEIVDEVDKENYEPPETTKWKVIRL